MIAAAPVRAPSFGIADLYPELKGPAPSTSQLSNPQEVAAAAGGGASGRILTGPPLDPRMALQAPATWLALLIVALLILGMRKG